MRTKNGETTEISFPNPSSLVAKSLIIDNKEEEGKEEQVEHINQAKPLENPDLSNNKEVSIEAHSFFIVPLQTHHEPKALAPQCLEEPSYAEIFNELCTQERKSRNHRPKKILQSKQVGYLRWQNILLECYEILKKKVWMGLVGYPND
jgi:hypothetical protein